MPTLYTGIGHATRRGSQMYRDVDGLRSIVKHRDEILGVNLDWSRDLDGDTISSVVNTANGVKLTAASNTPTVTSVNVDRIGSLKVKVTTGLGRVLIETIHFYPRNLGSRIKDY